MSRLDRGARLITELLAPSVVVVVLALLVAWKAEHTLAGTLVWGLLVALTSSVLPMAVIVWGARAGYWDGHHVKDRAGRLVPFLALIVLSAIGLGVLVAFGAPWSMIALDVAMLAGLVGTGMITVWWKVSMHTAVSGGAVMILCVVYTPLLLALWLFVVAVAWSRVRLRDHTVAQTAVGALVGAFAGGGIYLYLA